MRMYLLIFALLITSCNSSISNNREEHLDSVKCIVTKATKTYRYPGTLPDYSWKLETDCGYTLSSNSFYSIGDTISVKVIDVSSTNPNINKKN